MKYIDYKFNEPKLLDELTRYVDNTYSGHYTANGKGKIQTLEILKDRGRALDFILGSIDKYSSRLGYKDGYNRKDVLKIIHYGLLLLNVVDELNNKNEVNKTVPSYQNAPNTVLLTEEIKHNNKE